MALSSRAKTDHAGGVVRVPRWGGDDASLARALARGDEAAPAVLYDRYGEHVRRVLARVLGIDPELPDVLQEVFVQALRDIGSLEDPERLKAWLTRVAVFTARAWIRRRRRRNWLRFVAPERLPERTSQDDHEGREAMRRTYAVLDQMPTDERLAFVLRFIDDMELTEVADACGVSLATIKRRLSSARSRFTTLAGRDPVLRELITGRTA